MIKVNSREYFLDVLKDYLPKHCIGVEVGVLYGDFSKQLLSVLNPNKLYLVDPYETSGEQYKDSDITTAYSTDEDYHNLLNRFESEITENKIIINRDYSFNAVKGYQDNYFDFIYFDADHTYEGIKKDLNDWMPKLNNNGVLCGHDMVEFSNFGVIQSVNEFIKEQDFELIIFNEDGGDWAIKKKTK